MSEVITQGLEDIFELDNPFLEKEGQKILGLIKQDSAEGIMQTGQGPFNYRSRQYMDYKARGMNKKTGKGKLKAFRGISTNTDISKVNLYLTGQLLRGMKSKPITNGIEISFDPKDSGKVLGNKARGYDIVGLNDKNKDIVSKDITEYIEKQIGEKLNKSITITIG